jgi:hypothetical protein
MAASRPLRSSSGTFQSKVSMSVLLIAVPAVCRHVDPANPADVSKRAYDRWRSAAGWPGLPSATQVLRRLGTQSWPELLAVLTNPNRDLERTFARRLGREHEGEYDEARIALALQAAAQLLGTRTLSARAYDEARTRMVERARRMSDFVVRVPTVAQVESVAGTWDAACPLAGLDSGPMSVREGGMPIVQALEVMLDTYGVLPTQKELERFMRANRLALAKRTRPWADDLHELRRDRAQRGQETPDGPPPMERRPDYELPVAGLVGRPAQRKVATDEECLKAVRAWLRDLPPEERPTQRSYARWQARHPKRPSASVLGRHGGLLALRRLVSAYDDADTAFRYSPAAEP